jgi:hypothetical protein
MQVQGSAGTAASRLSQQEESATVDCVEVHRGVWLCSSKQLQVHMGVVILRAGRPGTAQGQQGLTNSERHLFRQVDSTARLAFISRNVHIESSLTTMGAYPSSAEALLSPEMLNARPRALFWPY